MNAVLAHTNEDRAKGLAASVEWDDFITLARNLAYDHVRNPNDTRLASLLEGAIKTHNHKADLEMGEPDTRSYERLLDGLTCELIEARDEHVGWTEAANRFDARGDA